MTTSELDKTKVRATVRMAMTLYKHNVITRRELYELAASALSWEISTGLTSKMQSKNTRFERKLYRVSHGRN